MAFSYALAATVLCVVVPPLVILYRILRVRVPGPLRPQTLLLGTFLDRKFVPSIFTRHHAFGALGEKYGRYVRIVGPLGKCTVFFSGAMPSWFSDRRMDSNRAGLRFILPRSILGMPLGSDWSRHRRAIAPLFSAKSLETQLPHILSACRELVDSNLQAGVMDLYPLMNAWSLDIIGRVAFGHEFGALAGAKDGHDSRYASAADGILGDLLRRFTKGPLASLDRAACAQGKAAMTVYRDTAVEIIRASAADDAPEAMRSSFAARLADRLPVEDCVQESISLLIAGHETSSNTACWALHLLATNPEQQAECRAEADSYPAMPSYKDLMAMTTLVGAVYEALRLYPIIIGPAKKTLRDDQIPGVPRGTYVAPNKAQMGRCPIQFPSPERFDCSRFGKGQHGKMGEPHCPFGAGPRICVGYSLAQLELVALLHAVLRRYELFPAGPGYPAPREHALITNGPRESGLFLKLVPR